MSSPEVTLLKRFVALCKADPDMLHKPEMAFYKEYLQSLGATIPSKTQKTSEQSQFTSNQFEEQQEPESEISEDVLPKPDLDESGILVDKSGNDLLPMGDQSKETTEEDMEQSNVNRDLAHTYFSQAEYEKSLEHYTKAIMLNPGSSMLFAKRANSLIKLSKFAEAIRDCDRAIKINPDSAQAYKFRGRAHRLLGHWIEAHSDLAIACKLDYDETANEWLKEVEPNAKKLHEYIRTKERLTEEKELQARRERVRKAQEANKHAAEDATASGQNAHDEGGEGFGMGPFADLFKDDPELLNALKKRSIASDESA